MHSGSFCTQNAAPASLLQELKGNIRVFARVRPASSSELAGDSSEQAAGNAMSAEFPSSGKQKEIF